MAEALVEALLSRGVRFIDTVAYRTEVGTYESAGFVVKQDHLNMFFDERPPWKNAGNPIDNRMKPEQ